MTSNKLWQWRVMQIIVIWAVALVLFLVYSNAKAVKLVKEQKALISTFPIDYAGKDYFEVLVSDNEQDVFFSMVKEIYCSKDPYAVNMVKKYGLNSKTVNCEEIRKEKERSQ